MNHQTFECFGHIGLAIDPIHVGTGGARLGRVDLSIARDPVTRVPKIPGSSLAGVYRTYAAMAKDKYPDCAGQGQSDAAGAGHHCGRPDCPICTVFGFARGQGSSGGFAGLAAFSDAHVLLFPIATRQGPLWVTSPEQLRIARLPAPQEVTTDAIYRDSRSDQPLNLGWLLVAVEQLSNHPELKQRLTDRGVPSYIHDRFGVLPDKLFSHVVNSNLEVRTSVSITPETGAAKEGALFTYEALPRATVLYWEITCKHPKHFKIHNQEITAVQDPNGVHDTTRAAHPYLEALGIGGMGTRGMGRLHVLKADSTAAVVCSESSTASEQASQGALS